MKPFKRIYIEITNVCNLSCSFCPKTQRAPSFMSTKDFEHILTEISPFTDYVYLHIKGEPLLHPELQDILSLCSQYHLHANITTNGTLIAQKASILSSANALRQVNISLHSFEQDVKLEQSNSAFQVIKDELYAYLKPITDYAIYMSQHTKAITALRLWNLEGEETDTLTHEKNRYVHTFLEEAFQVSIKPETITRGISLMERVYLNQDQRFQWPSLSVPVLSTEGFCYGLGTQVGILVDGTVVPCCLDQEGDVSLGNVFSTSFSSIMKGKRAQSMLHGFKEHKIVEELCKRCGYRHRFM